MKAAKAWRVTVVGPKCVVWKTHGDARIEHPQNFEEECVIWANVCESRKHDVESEAVRGNHDGSGVDRISAVPGYARIARDDCELERGARYV